MGLALFLTLALATLALFAAYVYLRSTQSTRVEEDLAQLVQHRRPPTGETLERLSRQRK